MVQMLGYYVLPKNALTAKKHPRKRKFCGGALSNIRFLMPAGVFHMQSIFRKFPKEFISLKKAPAKRRFFLERVTGIEPA